MELHPLEKGSEVLTSGPFDRFGVRRVAMATCFQLALGPVAALPRVIFPGFVDTPRLNPDILQRSRPKGSAQARNFSTTFR